jgi:hypothetical protein
VEANGFGHATRLSETSARRRCEQCRPHCESPAGCVVVASSARRPLDGWRVRACRTERLVVGGVIRRCASLRSSSWCESGLSGDSCRCSAIGAVATSTGQVLVSPCTTMRNDASAGRSRRPHRPSPVAVPVSRLPTPTVRQRLLPRQDPAGGDDETPCDTRDPQISGGRVSESDSTCASPAELGDVAIAQHHGVGPMGSDVGDSRPLVSLVARGHLPRS